MNIRKSLINLVDDMRTHETDEEAWPIEDDYAGWQAGYELATRAFICSAPEFANTPICGIGRG